MHFRHLSLQNFRSYTKAEFTFSSNTTVIVGPNTSGKTNLIEAIVLLSTGKSFRAEKDAQLIQFEKELARVKGPVELLPRAGGFQPRAPEERVNRASIELEVVLTTGEVGGKKAPLKKYMVNGVGKRLVDFASHLPTVLFSPADLSIIADSPSGRRKFLDSVLEQASRDYHFAHTEYIKALRQRNALLEQVQETGRRNDKLFEYWDGLLIKNGEVITKTREAFLAEFNKAHKEIFDCSVVYDSSVISKERLLQYKDAEVGAGATLVGPHRDDFTVFLYDNTRSTTHDIRFFGSRGQQRLAILQLKVFQLDFLEKTLRKRPLLLLDDIFSELDSKHIDLVMELIGQQQTILTTTHGEFINLKKIKQANMIKLDK